eukprot:gene10388-2917_t
MENKKSDFNFDDFFSNSKSNSEPKKQATSVDHFTSANNNSTLDNFMNHNSFQNNQTNIMSQQPTGGSFSYNKNNSILDLFNQPTDNKPPTGGSFNGFSTINNMNRIPDTFQKSISFQAEKNDEEWGDFEGGNQLTQDIKISQLNVQNTTGNSFHSFDQKIPDAQANNVPKTQENFLKQEEHEEEEWSDFKGESDDTHIKEMKENENFNGTVINESSCVESFQQKEINEKKPPKNDILDLFGNSNDKLSKNESISSDGDLKVQFDENDPSDEEEWGEFESNLDESRDFDTPKKPEFTQQKKETENIENGNSENSENSFNSQTKISKRNIGEMFQKFEEKVESEKMKVQKKSNILDLFNQSSNEIKNHQDEEEEEWGEFEGNYDSNVDKNRNDSNVEETINENLNDEEKVIETHTSSSNETTTVPDSKMNILDLFGEKNEITVKIESKPNSQDLHGQIHVSDDEWGEFEGNNEKKEPEIVTSKEIPSQSSKENQFSNNMIVNSKHEEKTESNENDDEWGEFEGNNHQKVVNSNETEKLDTSKMNILDLFGSSENSKVVEKIPVEQETTGFSDEENWGEYKGNHEITEESKQMTSKETDPESSNVQNLNEQNKETNNKIEDTSSKMNILELFVSSKDDTKINENLKVENEETGFSDEENWGEFEGNIHDDFKESKESDIKNSQEIESNLNSAKILDSFDESTIPNISFNNQNLDVKNDVYPDEIKNHQDEEEEDWGDFEAENHDEKTPRDEIIVSEPMEDQQPKDKLDDSKENLNLEKMDNKVDIEQKTNSNLKILDLFDNSEIKSTVNFKHVEPDEDEWGEFEGNSSIKDSEKFDIDDDWKESSFQKETKKEFNLDDLISQNHPEKKENNHHKGILDLFSNEETKDEIPNQKNEIMNSLIKQERFDDALKYSKSNDALNHLRKRLDPISQVEMFKFLDQYIKNEHLSKQFKNDFPIDLFSDIDDDLEKSNELKLKISLKFDEIFEEDNYFVRVKIQCLRELEIAYQFLENLISKNQKVIDKVLKNDEMTGFLKGIKTIYKILTNFENEKLNDFKELFKKISNENIDDDDENINEEKICELCGKMLAEGDEFCVVNGKDFYVPALNLCKKKITKTFYLLKK